MKTLFKILFIGTALMVLVAILFVLARVLGRNRIQRTK